MRYWDYCMTRARTAEVYFPCASTYFGVVILVSDAVLCVTLGRGLFVRNLD